MDTNCNSLWPSFIPDTGPSNVNDIVDMCKIYLEGDESRYMKEEENEEQEADGRLSTQDHELAFRQLPVSAWSGEHCESWACMVLHSNGLGHKICDLWPLRSESGSDLLQFTRQDFCNLITKKCGDLLHSELQKLQRQEAGTAVSRLEDNKNDIGHESLEFFSFPHSSNDTSYLCQDDFSALDSDDHSLVIPDYYLSTEKTDVTEGFPRPSLSENCILESHNENFVPIEDELTSETEVIASDQSETSIPLDKMLESMPAKNRRRNRGPKNWEFLMRLLVDPRTNPSIIEWHDEESDTFILKKPQIIAQMWGSRNHTKGDLSYNNFARGLRHHYKAGTLVPIPERQLVYRCGPKALEYLRKIRCTQS